MSANPWQSGLEEARRSWGWFLALGIILILLGMAALGSQALATKAAVILIGVVLLLSGGAQVAEAFYARRWAGFFLHLLIGVLDVIVGLLCVVHPLVMGEVLTLLLACFFMVSGIFRIIVAIAVRFPNWGWALLGGLITFMLGVLVWAKWPYSGEWFLGLAVGISLLFQGWSWVMLALTLRSVPTPPVAPPP